jgi:hypothetical protein
LSQNSFARAKWAINKYKITSSKMSREPNAQLVHLIGGSSGDHYVRIK